MRRNGATQQQLADRFGVTQQGISRTLKASDRVGGMPCPQCGGGSRTMQTWPPVKGTIKRKHWCRDCWHVWTSTQRNDK